MKKKTLSQKTPTILLAFLVLCFFVCVALYVYLNGYTKHDITGHWRICRYAIEGYNPYLLIGQEAAVESIGKIPAAFSTVPWSCVFGSFFYGGFFPLEVAQAYIYVLHFVSLFALMVVLYKYFKPDFSGVQLAALVMIPVAHFSFIYSLHFGNAGAIICCMMVIAFLISEKHPYIAGVIMGLAMMKPQISAVVCLAFLFRKQFKVLFTAAGIVLAGWAATSIMTSTNPIELLFQTLSSGTAAETQYLGLLNNLKYFDVSSTVILLMNVVIGCVYTTALVLYLKKKCNSLNSLMVFVPACIASTFWIYKNGTDYLITAFAALLLCVLFMKKEMKMADYLVSLFSIGFLEMSRCAVYLGIKLFEDNLFIRDLFKSAEGLVLAIVGGYLCYLWCKYDGDSLMKDLSHKFGGKRKA